ncbi:MAG: hypothetical protein PWP27_1218 [Clostridiales bacterium]|jgi:hypothetical protein|nr:hypothetical protein [Clostridiales bacterium]
MKAVLGILMVTAGIILLEVPCLLEKKLKKELWVFSMLLTFGVIISILMAFGVQLPSPKNMITVIYKPLGDIIFGILQ